MHYYNYVILKNMYFMLFDKSYKKCNKNILIMII